MPISATASDGLRWGMWPDPGQWVCLGQETSKSSLNSKEKPQNAIVRPRAACKPPNKM